MPLLELLSPAKDLECGLAAINYGADAVYIAADRFGARAAAANSIQDIEKLISYAHKFKSKIYITLNTILFDRELEAARELIQQIYEAGADALIIQDLGLLEMDLPPIPIHASTQTHNFTWEKVKFLENVGIQRVVLARELTLQQIELIRSHTTCELEFFVGGALCVSLSGQCYLSCAAGGRSANRGECAQPCRLPYSLVDSSGTVLVKDKHLLSLKDLNLSNSIQELALAGVSSFKIEGRLKDVNYVKNTTAHYRQKIDAILNQNPDYQRSSSGKSLTDFIPNPEKTFNRSFSNYFLYGRKKDIVSFDSPKSMGMKLGEVVSIHSAHVVIDTEEKIANGDGICFLNKKGELVGKKVNRAEGKRVYPTAMDGFFVGAIIYRNSDQEFTKQLNNSKVQRYIGVNFIFSETENGFQIEATDEDGYMVVYQQNTPKEPAKNVEMAQQSILQQISKTGDSIFKVEQAILQLDKHYFIPTSVLNEMRRNVFQLLESKRDNLYNRHEFQIAPNQVEYPEKELDYHGNVSNHLAEKFYKRHGVKLVMPAFETLNQYKDKVVMTTHHCLKFQLGWCPKFNKVKSINLKEPLYLVDNQNKYRLDFDCKACVMKVIF